MKLPYRLGLVLIFCLNLLPLTHAQTWEQLFVKAEKQYTKGKYQKTEKIARKMREKKLKKKFNGDSTLLALTYIVEARGNMARAQYQLMNQHFNQGLELLSNHQIGHSYNYTAGLLHAIDYYNEYGNHRKADSLVTVLQKLNPAFFEVNLLQDEIAIRRAVTDAFIGNYNDALKSSDELIKTWPIKLKQSYNFEKVKPEDIQYKTDLLIALYTAQLDAYRGKGEYEKAFDIMEQRNKQVNKLVAGTSKAYTDYRVAEAKTVFEFGDTKAAKKMMDRLMTLKPRGGRVYQKAGMMHIQVSEAVIDIADAVTTSEKIETALLKSKVNRPYVRYNNEYMYTVMQSFEADVEENIILKQNKLLERIRTELPYDHPDKTAFSTFAIDYVMDLQRVENFPMAEKFYVHLGNSLNARYPDKSLPTTIYKVNLAGYYLKYSETPSKAFKLLAGDVYKKPLDELSSTHPDYARIVSDLMEYFSLIGNFDYPINLMKSVIAAMEANPNTEPTEIGKKRVELARMQIQGGYYKEAEQNTDQALKTLRKGGEKKSEEFVQALNNAAFLYGTIGLYDKAERELQRADKIYGKLNTVNQELRLQSIVDLAALYTRMGKYSETEELLHKAIDERRKLYGSESRRLIKPFEALGEMFMIRGDYPEAEKSLRQSLAICDRVYGDTTLIFAETLSKLVKLYIDLGNYQAALVNATDILKIRQKYLRPDHILFAETYTDLGNIYYNIGGKMDAVDQYYQLALDITLKNFNNKHPLYAEALKNSAYVYIYRQEYDEALRLLNEADDIWTDALDNLNRSSGEVARIKGDIYNYQRKFRDARREYEKAAKYFRSIFSESHPEFLNTKSRLARAYYINDELARVESMLSETTQAYMDYTREYFPTLSEEEKARFWNKIKPDFEFYNTVAVRYADKREKYLENMYDFTLATKGLLLNSSIKTRNSIMNSGNAQLIELFKTWVTKKEELTTLSARTQEDLTTEEIDLNKLKDEIAVLEKKLSESSQDFEDSFEYKLYSWTDVRKALKDDEAAVEIIRYREFDDQFNEEKIRYAALIVTSETRKNPELVWFENGKEMETKSFHLHRNVTKFKIADKSSYATYWQPIHDKIKDKKVVYLSPDGVYNQLNVETFLLEDGKYVIDVMNVRVVNNTKTVAAMRSKEAIKASKKEKPAIYSAMLMGNPKYYVNDENLQTAQKQNNRGGNNVYIPQLPGTEKEVITINELLAAQGWKIEYYLGTNATEEQIKQAQNYTLVHIATHGFFDDKPMKKNSILLEDDDNPLERSGLLAEGGGDVLVKATKNYNIEDGILTAYEAMSLNFENTELIVLSACETGRGEIQQGEGVFGLQRSFLVAGADAIVMSLFQVSDEVTQKLMVEFYRNWLSGQDKRTAFNNAQLAIKAEYNDPIYWGAFTMIAKS